MEKVQISSTTFIDYVAAEGSKKVTRVRQARKLYAEAYNPAADFYRLLREAIVSMHENDGDKRDLDTVFDGLHLNKVASYRSRVREYKAWLGKKSVEFVETPQRRLWAAEELQVRVNPELVLRINGEPYVIKLYFKKDRLLRVSIAAALHLLEKTPAAREGAVPAVLDIKRRKLISKTKEVPDHIEALLRAEAASFVSLWHALGEASSGAA